MNKFLDTFGGRGSSTGPTTKGGPGPRPPGPGPRPGGPGGRQKGPGSSRERLQLIANVRPGRGVGPGAVRNARRALKARQDRMVNRMSRPR